MDEDHVGCAVRYVLLNPVRARLVEHADDWHWSSVPAHLGIDDGLTDHEPIARRFPDLAKLLASTDDEDRVARLRRAETIGRPIGSAAFVEHLEREAGRTLKPRRRGRRPKLDAQIASLN